MSAADGKKDKKDALSNLLSFGPDIEETLEATPNEVNERILKIVKNLKEISLRIDKLASRL